MNRRFLVALIGFICFISCKEYVVLKVTDKEMINNCEFAIGDAEKYYTSLEEFKNDNSKKIRKLTNVKYCKCDTLFFDLDDLFDMHKTDKGLDYKTIWGVCSSKRVLESNLKNNNK